MAFSRMKLPVHYLDVWTMSDLFDFIDLYSKSEKKSVGERTETASTADEMEVF